MEREGSRAERWVRERWPAIRARGALRFLLVRGVLQWGGLMAAVVTAMLALSLGIAHPRLPLLLAIALPLCAASGLLWAALTWWINERIYLSLTSNRNS